MNNMMPNINKLRATCNAQPAVLVFALLLVSAGCSAPGPSPEMVLARVNEDTVTVEVMEEAFKASHQGHSAFLAGQEVIREVLDKVIDKQLLLQEARRIGLDYDPEVTRSVEALRASRASEQFYRDKITDQISISDKAIADAHKQMSDSFQAQTILAESREAAEKALDRIKAGADFGQIALEVSQADTAGKGGYMGIIRWGRLEPELERKLWTLKTGQVSEPFETEDGWNLLYVVEKKSGQAPPLEKVSNQIRAVLTKRETTKRSDRLFFDLTKKWKAEIHESTLRDFIKARDKQDVSPDAVLADIGNEKITVAQILPRVDLNKIHKLTDAAAMREMRNLLEDDIFRMLIKKEALVEGYGKKPAIEKEVETVTNRLAVDRLMNDVMFAQLDATDDEAQAYWRSHQNRFTEPEMVKLSLIVAESESEGNKILSDLQAGRDFAATAKNQFTQQPFAQLGEQIGWIPKGKLKPELEKVAFSLREGQSGIAQSEAKYIVIRVDGKRPERLKPFSEVKEEAKQLALQEKSRQILKSWITKLREASVIQIDDDAIVRAGAAYEEKFREKVGPEKKENESHGS